MKKNVLQVGIITILCFIFLTTLIISRVINPHEDIKIGNFEVAGESADDCTICDIKQTQTKIKNNILFDGLSNPLATTTNNATWSIIDCMVMSSGNCEMCYQLLDHDGDGPKPPELHMWIYCWIDGERKLMYHVWCEDADDPETCKCLDGCTSQYDEFFEYKPSFLDKP